MYSHALRIYRKARGPTSIKTIQVWAQEAQEDLARFSTPDHKLLFDG
jgi:hypothetical protein